MVQPFRPAEVHGERCGERAATGLDVLPQIPHVLPHIDQLTQPQQQAATHYLVPAGARIGFGLKLRDGGTHPLCLTPRRRRSGAHPDGQIREQALQRRSDPIRRPQRRQTVADRSKQRQQQHHAPLHFDHPAHGRLVLGGVIRKL